MSPGQTRLALATGIADRTDKARASYEAEATTPLEPVPPTTTGTLRRDGSRRRSTSTKKASISRWMIGSGKRSSEDTP